MASPAPATTSAEPKCEFFFDINNPLIPENYRSDFRQLAGRAGNPSEVDTCDLKDFYESKNVPDSIRLLDPNIFKKEERTTFGVGHPYFDYVTFDAHVRRVKNFGNLLRGSELEKMFTDDSFAAVKTNTLQDLLAVIPGKNQEARRMLAEKAGEYPYKGIVSEKEMTWILLGKPSSLLLPVMYGVLPLADVMIFEFHKKQEGFAVLDFSDRMYWQVSSHDAKGGQEYSIQIDMTAALETDFNTLGIPRFYTLADNNRFLDELNPGFGTDISDQKTYKALQKKWELFNALGEFIDKFHLPGAERLKAR